MFRVLVPVQFEIFVDASSLDDALKVGDAMMDATEVFWQTWRGQELEAAREDAGQDGDVFRFRDEVIDLVDDLTVYYRIGCHKFYAVECPGQHSVSIMAPDFPERDDIHQLAQVVPLLRQV